MQSYFRRLLPCAFLTLSLFSSCISVSQSKKNFDLANEYAKDGLLREAIDSYLQALKEDPDNLTIQRNLGMVYMRSGAYEDAKKFLTKALRAFKDDYEVNYELAQALRSLGDYSEAIYYYRSALLLKEDFLPAKKALAWSYYKIRYYKAAIETIMPACKKFPKDSQNSIIAARILLKLKKHTKALALLKKAKDPERKKDAAYISSVEGDIYLSLGKVDQAAALYNFSLQQEPLLAGALLGLGKVHLRKEQRKTGITYMERAMRIMPQLTEVYFQLASAYETIDPSKSLYYYRIFSKKAASDPEYLTQLGSAQAKIEDLSRKLDKL